MDYRILFKEENENIKERYDLAMERIGRIPHECSVEPEFRDYFIKVSEYILFIKELSDMVMSGKFDSLTMDEYKEINEKIYKDISISAYDKSYANPAYACRKLGGIYGQILSALYSYVRGMAVYACESRLTDITIYCELFIEVYNCFENEETLNSKEIRDIIYWFYSDYCDVKIPYRIREQIDPKLDFATRIIIESDLNDLSYLYKYGEYVGENEIGTAKYLNSLPESEIDKMADAYTEGYRLGFELAGKDLSKKKTVNIRYNIGFERIVRKAILNFGKMGLEPVIYRSEVNPVNGSLHMVGYTSTLPNKQYWYDHRFDNVLYLNKAINERKLGVLKNAYESMKELAAGMAGPACIEIFGEKPFEPENKPEAYSFGKRQQKNSTEYSSAAGRIVNQYIKGDERSFTIIAFPVPEIGDDYKAIFEETVRINTLDQDVYRKVQQAIIDSLDKAEYERVTGKGKNKTYINVALHELADPKKQTNFENCLADVNIPLGEVFTSPKLTGTNGLLHVSEVYLGELKFIDLEIEFEDGCVKDYTCKNFKKEKDNKKLIKESILMGHDTLPLGEFAIGTNTTAYAVANKYDIIYKMPILIVEKMGPHFAVGDTCFSWDEDNKTYNPDGKEIIAKDNEKSILRKTDLSKAYFNCHTDITIPYTELGEITAVCSDGSEIPVISDGRFVLEGTEILNEALDV